MYTLNVLGSLGNEYWQLGEYGKAVEILKEAAELSNDVLNPERLGSIYSMLSASYNAQGDTAHAKRYALHSIQSYAEVGNKRQAAYVHSRLGRAYLHADQLEEAEAHLRVANDMARKLDDPRGISESARCLSEPHPHSPLGHSIFTPVRAPHRLYAFDATTGHVAGIPRDSDSTYEPRLFALDATHLYVLGGPWSLDAGPTLRNPPDLYTLGV